MTLYLVIPVLFSTFFKRSRFVSLGFSLPRIILGEKSWSRKSRFFPIKHEMQLVGNGTWGVEMKDATSAIVGYPLSLVVSPPLLGCWRRFTLRRHSIFCTYDLQTTTHHDLSRALYVLDPVCYSIKGFLRMLIP